MKQRDFMCIGKPFIKVDKHAHAEFLLTFQKAMLQSLVDRKLLSVSQMEQVSETLDMRLKRK